MSHKLYKTKRWQITRQRILKRDLYTCQMPGCGCGLTKGRTHPRAAVVDHKTPHNGDPELFWCPDEGLQSTCLRCHNRTKQAIEKRGYSDQIGVDGFPVDKRHPFWAGPPMRWGYSVPHGIEPSAIPVTLVCGPPASGKSTWVQNHSKLGDVVVDFDVIRKKVGGAKWSQDGAAQEELEREDREEDQPQVLDQLDGQQRGEDERGQHDTGARPLEGVGEALEGLRKRVSLVQGMLRRWSRGSGASSVGSELVGASPPP